MRSAAWHGVFFLMMLIPISLCQAACRLPEPGKCSQNNNTVADNMVCPPAKASCSFSDGDQLCDYKQGCRDPGMTNWTVVQGVAIAIQTHAGFCGRDYYYSVLESPWLEFTVTSCLKFRYKRYRPAAVDVFLALHNGSVITILDRTRNSEGTVTSHAWTVNTGIWKIKFRAYGASGPDRVEVHSVSWSPGRCESSGETPSDGSNRNATAPGNSGSTTEDCKLLTTTMTTAPPMPSTSKQNTASRSTSLVISSSGPSSSSSSVPVTRAPFPRNCAEAITMGYGSFGQQTLDINPQLTGICVSCVKDWAVILRRQPSSVDFYRGWEDYVNGFGDVDGAHWLGLETIYQLTSQGRYDLRVELGDWEGLTATADYDGFGLASAADNYRLHVDNFTGGSAGDSLTLHSGMQFSTKDVDNDMSSTHCSAEYVGAWWYNSCHYSSLCGEFKPSSVTEYGRGVQWYTWKGYRYSLQFAQLITRPSD